MTKGIEHNASYEHSPALSNEEKNKRSGKSNRTRAVARDQDDAEKAKRIGLPTERERVLATKKAE